MHKPKISSFCGYALINALISEWGSRVTAFLLGPGPSDKSEGPGPEALPGALHTALHTA